MMHSFSFNRQEVEDKQRNDRIMQEVALKERNDRIMSEAVIPTKMNWNTVDDPKIGYYDPNGNHWPRLGLEPQDWEQALRAELVKRLQEIFDMCVEYLDAPIDDKDDPYLIDRFLVQTLQYIARCRKFLTIVKKQWIPETPKQLYNQRQWCRSVWHHGKTRVVLTPESWPDICGRAALVSASWGPIYGVDSARVKKLIENYHKTHGEDKIHSHTITEYYKNKYPLFEFNPTIKIDCKPKFISIEAWNAIDWQPRQPPQIVVCPGIYILSLGIDLQGVTQSKDKELFNENNSRCAKLGNLRGFQFDFIDSMYDTNEMIQTADEFQALDVESNVLKQLRKETTDVVCVVCIILAQKLFPFVLCFCVVVCFLDYVFVLLCVFFVRIK